MVISIFDDKINQKKFLYGLTGICLGANIISSICFYIHSCPIKRINIEEEKKDFENNKEELILLSNNQINAIKQLVDEGTQTIGIEDKNIKKIKTFTFCGYLFLQKTKKMNKISVFFINIVENGLG